MPFADINGTTLHYCFDGPEQGPVVMLSNSLASDLAMWTFQVPALVEAGYRVLRYDTRGHGQSEVPEGPYSIEMLTAEAVGLLDGLGLNKVHFCGLSMGGMIGQMLGTQYGNRLISLTLSSTAAYMGLKKSGMNVSKPSERAVWLLRPMQPLIDGSPKQAKRTWYQRLKR